VLFDFVGIFITAFTLIFHGFAITLLISPFLCAGLADGLQQRSSQR
jgi:hypothetical protein